jgi:hypothetical protein
VRKRALSRINARAGLSASVHRPRTIPAIDAKLSLTR